MNTIALALSLIYLAESQRGTDLIPRDGSDSVGPLQIQKQFVDEVNRILKAKAFSYDDRKDFRKSCDMAEIWLTHYGAKLERKIGRPLNHYDYAMLFNAGLKGYLLGRGQAYLNSINKKLALLKRTDALIVALKG